MNCVKKWEIKLYTKFYYENFVNNGGVTSDRNVFESPPSLLEIGLLLACIKIKTKLYHEKLRIDFMKDYYQARKTWNVEHFLLEKKKCECYYKLTIY